MFHFTPKLSVGCISKWKNSFCYSGRFRGNHQRGNITSTFGRQRQFMRGGEEELGSTWRQIFTTWIGWDLRWDWWWWWSGGWITGYWELLATAITWQCTGWCCEWSDAAWQSGWDVWRWVVGCWQRGLWYTEWCIGTGLGETMRRWYTVASGRGWTVTTTKS